MLKRPRHFRHLFHLVTMPLTLVLDGLRFLRLWVCPRRVQDEMTLLVKSCSDVNTPRGLMAWPNAMHGQLSLEDSQIASRGMRRKPYHP
jgi:hypothetical protein